MAIPKQHHYHRTSHTSHTPPRFSLSSLPRPHHRMANHSHSHSHLANPLPTPGQLASSGSQLDGVPADLVSSVLFAGARLTQQAGVLLRLPHDTIAQAVLIFTRFWIGSEGGSLSQYSVKVTSCLSTLELPLPGLRYKRSMSLKPLCT